MSMFAFDVVSVRAWASFGTWAGKSKKWHLAFDVRLAPMEDFRLRGGEKPDEDFEITVQFRESDSALIKRVVDRTGDLLEKDDEVWGTAQHHVNELTFDIMTPGPLMDSLVAFAEQGRHPSRLRISVGGLDFKGGEWVWPESEEFHLLPVTSVEMSMPISERSEPGARTAMTAVGADLAPGLAEILKWQKATAILVALVGLILLLS